MFFFFPSEPRDLGRIGKILILVAKGRAGSPGNPREPGNPTGAFSVTPSTPRHW